MKLFGHPLHVMLIHFPSALFPMEGVCYGIFYYTGNMSFATASFYSLIGGVLLGWTAVISGSLDLIKIPFEKIRAVKTALVHGAINTTVVIGYTVITWTLYREYPGLPAATDVLLIIRISLIIFMFAGNYFGGRLVFKHKIGVE